MKKFLLVIFVLLMSCEDQHQHPELDNQVCANSLVTGTGSGIDKENAAPSCKYIKMVSNVNMKSGKAWLDIDGPDGSLPAFIGFCDMDSDGGGWTLVSKIKYTVRGPSKIEMTGDKSLIGLAKDPMSGGEFSSFYTELEEFTSPRYPNYFPIAFNGDALQTNVDNVKATAPGECFAIMSREIIEGLRVNCSASLGKNIEVSRENSIIKQDQLIGENLKSKSYIKSSKFFNPIQHKCESPVSTCNSKDKSGCHPGLISTVYENYDSTTGKVSGLKTSDDGWMEDCSKERANGLMRDLSTAPKVGDTILPAGWMSGGLSGSNPSAFYDLSESGDKSSHSSSGSVNMKAQNDKLYSYCYRSGDCGFTLIYVK